MVSVSLVALATVGGPPRYSWLGTQELPTEFPSGVAAMGARSYVPQLGRFLQPDPKAGGSANAYAYTYGNPLNESDPSGQWSLNQTSGGLSAVGMGEGEQLAGGTGIAAGAIMPAPVNAQIEAAFWASPPWDQEVAGNEEYEEYEEYGEEWGEEGWEEEGGYEGYAYASNHQNGPEHEEAHTELGLLELAQGEAALGGGEGESGSAIVPLCGSGAERACAHSIGGVHGHNTHGGGYYHGVHRYVRVDGGGRCFAAGAAAVAAGPFVPITVSVGSGVGLLALCS